MDLWLSHLWLYSTLYVLQSRPLGSTVNCLAIITASSGPTSVHNDSQKTASTMSRGKFIVLEGLDRSGKSTQVERLVKKLDAKLQKFPGKLLIWNLSWGSRAHYRPKHCYWRHD